VSTASAFEEKIRAASKRLLSAADNRQPCEPVRDLIGTDDVALAYAVQQELSRVRVSRGSRVVGRKIGATSAAVQEQLGIAQPDFGMLFDDMAHADGATIIFDSVLQPRVEAEVAFILGADLGNEAMGLEHVRSAVSHVVAAIEICGSRIRDWNITFADTVADNASAGAFVLGSELRSLDEVDLATASMSMTMNGQVASTGGGADCLGNPMNAVLWLARQALALGAPLRAGELVLSGALGPMRPAEPGATVSACISGLGEVSLQFSDGTRDE